MAIRRGSQPTAYEAYDQSVAIEKKAQASDECDQALPYTCSSCGLRFAFDMNVHPSKCPWCGACVECG